jgi:hypothetical protein
MSTPPATPPAKVRDLRLDFFRGLSLWFIFLNHVPSNSLSWVTVSNFGFSDAAEIFVFLSGYTAAFVYGRIINERGLVVGAARILKRTWQLYVAFVFLSVIYIAQIAWAASRFENPLFAEEMNIVQFLERPDIILLEVLRLRFLLANVDVLPLYVVLMLFFPLMIWGLLRAPTVALLVSIAIYLVAKWTGLNLKLYPTERNWFFNPFAWQLLFMIGAWCAVSGSQWLEKITHSNILLVLSIAYLLFAAFLKTFGVFPSTSRYLPNWLWIFPLDKTGLSPLRLLHFLALAIVVVHFIPRDAAWLNSPWAQPVIECGKHSLEIFCLGVFLSFTAHFVLVEISARLWMQLIVSVSGVLLMIGLAALMSWYQGLDRRSQQKAAA